MSGQQFTSRTIQLLALACVGLVLWPDAADATTRVRRCKTYRNRTGMAATDFHYKAWQKEDDIEIVGFGSTATGLNGASVSGNNCMRGDQPEPAHSKVNTLGPPGGINPDNGQHAIDCDITGTFPAGSSIRVCVNFELTRYNTIRFHDPMWTFNRGGAGPVRGTPLDAGPNDGLELTDPVFVNGMWHHRIIITNDDNNGTSESFEIRNLRFGTVPDYNTIDSDSALIAFASFSPPQPNVTLNPGESFNLIVPTPDRLSGGGIVVAYDVHDPNTGEQIGDSLTGHEVGPEPAPAGVPTISEWGLIIFSLLLIIAAVHVYGRGRQFVAAGVAVDASIGRSFWTSFDAATFAKALCLTTGVAIVGCAAAYRAFGELALRDAIGSLLTAGVAAYLIQLCYSLRKTR